MASVDQIVTRLEDLSDGVCSEKVTQRNKAIDQIKQIFDASLATVQEILTGATVSSLTPKYVFSNVFNGLIKHASRQELSQSQRTDNKASVFITIIQYLIDYCNQVEANRIQTSLIFDSLLSIFEDGFYARQYGSQFLNILSLYLSSPNHSNFFNVDKGLWKRLLEGCKTMCESSGGGPRNMAIQCIAQILELGSLYSYLPDVLVDFVPFLESLFIDADKYGNVNEVFKISFLLTKILSVSYQYEMCLFSENVCHFVLKNYKTNMKEELKSQIFEYLHLILVIHEPQYSHPVPSKMDWRAIKTSIGGIVEVELNFLNEYKFTRDLDILPDALLSCAAYLYFTLIIAGEEDLMDDDDVVEIVPRNEKRLRQSSELEKLLTRARPNDKKFVWRWFVILGSVLHKRPLLELPQNEINALVRLCSESIDLLTFENQFKALYRICKFLVDAKVDIINWEGITQGIYKLTVKYQSSHSVELLQFVLEHQLCTSKEIMEIYNYLTGQPADEINIRSLTWLCRTNEFREIIGEPKVEKDLLVNYLGSNGHLVLSRANFQCAIDFVMVLMNIPEEDEMENPSSNCAIKCLEETRFEHDIEEIMRKIEVKSVKTTLQMDQKAKKRIYLSPEDFNKSLLRKLFKSIFIEIDETENHISSVVQLMLRQLEFTTRFLQRISQVLDISKVTELLGDIFVKLEGNLKALAKTFQSQISEEDETINKLLEFLNNFLAVDYVKDLKPVLNSSGFLLQVAIWTRHQFLAGDNSQAVLRLNDEKIAKNPKTKRNSLVIENILHLGAINERILKEYWIEMEMNNATSISTSFNILKRIAKLPPNATMVKIVLGELEDIFTSHHKNEKVSGMVLEILTELLIVFKECPISITEWDKFVNQYIMWGCKQKYSPQLTIKLLDFYDQFFANFFEHRDLNPDLQEYITESLSRFIVSKNFDIQMKTVQVFVRICGTNHVLLSPKQSFKTAIEYCHFINKVAKNVQMKRLLEMEGSGENYRMVDKDEQQNQSAVVHTLICGIVGNNETLAGHFLIQLIKFYGSNPDIKRQPDLKIEGYVEEHLAALIGYWLAKEQPITSFPYFLVGSQILEDFMEKYQVTIGMHVIQYRPWKEFCELSKKFNLKALAEELQKKFLIFTLLPKHEVNKSANFKKNIAHLNCESLTLTERSTKHLVALLHNLHENYWDAGKFIELFKFPLPEDLNSQFSINDSNYCEAIQALNSKAVRNKQSFIVNMCMKHPESILLILSDIQQQIFSAKFLFAKLKNLQKLFKLCELIMEFVERPSDNDQIGLYKSQFVKSIVLYIVNEMNHATVIPNPIKVQILNLTLDIIKRTIPHCCQMYSDNLNCIVTQLMSLAMKNKEDSLLCECVADIFKYFIEDCKLISPDLLANIDILPEDHPAFEYVSTIQTAYSKQTIQGEIERFLALPQRGIYSLKYLRRKILEHEKEFIELFQELTQGLRTVPNTDNVAHKLVLSLLRYIQNGEDEVRIEASKILGDLGPVDLNTMVLRNNAYRLSFPSAFDSQSDALANFLPEIVEYLQRLQYEYKPPLTDIIIKALIEVLQQPEAESLLDTRRDLIIFKQAKASSTPAPFFDSGSQLSQSELFTGFVLSPFSNISFLEWVNRNTQIILKFFGNSCLARVAEKELSFGIKLLPLMITILLSLKNDLINKGLQETLNKFFRDFEVALLKRTDNEQKSTPLILDKRLLNLMLDLVEIVRIYNQNFPEQIKLNYLSVASAAQYCNLHGNAILYGELWVEVEKSIRKCSENELPLTDLRAIMIPSYEALEVPDAVKPFLDLNRSRYKYYLLENAWEFAYLESTSGLMSKRQGRVESLNQTHCLSSAKFTDSYQMNYETIWRLGDWDQLKSLPMASTTGVASEFQKDHCLALKCLHLGDELKAKSYLNCARDRVFTKIFDSSLDCTKGVYESLTALKQIQQMEDVLSETKNWKAILEKWTHFDALQTNSFEQQEEILIQRISILQSRCGQRSAPLVEKQMRGTILELIRLAKEDRNFKAAITNLKNLENMELDNEAKSRMILEDGHLQFIAGHSELAKHLYLKLINEEEFKETFSKIAALRLMAEYLTDNLMVNPNEILQNYILPAKKLHTAYSQKDVAKNKSGYVRAVVEERVKIFDTTAKFADTIYTQRNNYMKSSDYAEKKRLHLESKAEYQQVSGKSKGLSKAEQIRVYNLKQTIILEDNQLKSVAAEREKYLCLAIESYTKSCTLNEGLNDLQICRIVSLWFTNINVQSIGKSLQENLPKVPSYKFLLILPQIAARLSHSDKILTRTISEALIRCCQQHPHQSIYHVLALYNAHEDNKTAEISSSMETRICNTKLIVDKLMADTAIGPIVRAAQNLGIALIKLANKEVKDSDTRVGRELMSLEDMYRIAAPTVELPVKINLKYSNQFPYITNWVPNFRMVGGVNAPKKLTFRCSDGISRSMLVKGKDDLRQDAVMQQVFHFMNILLKTKKSSCKRNLAIRTYKIVPLTQMSGILEFCDNTNTLGNYLVAAHEKYHPDDLKPQECRTLMTNCAKKTAEEKLAQFGEICERLSPVFQHFFTENFFSPVEWFEKRMFYINSVATTSMVGYIMGIGDRHVNNILIDKSTAEVIHIDFGIALEKGKLLPTPEKVPFRLTRDLVAAMGCFGVDGLFRTSCEITMQVLRENKALINTIVEVFLYDPLYTWFSNKKRSSSDQNDDEKNALAARVLIRVNEKLNGRDENDTTAIENQVEKLIRQATSPVNLSQMFYGWQAYL